MTSFHHQPEAQQRKSSAIHKKRRPITLSIGRTSFGHQKHGPALGRAILLCKQRSAYNPKRRSGVAAAREIMTHLHAHTRTSSFPLLAATKPLKTSLIWSHDFSFFMLSSQRLILG